jgi:hypothetical protein
MLSFWKREFDRARRGRVGRLGIGRFMVGSAVACAVSVIAVAAGAATGSWTQASPSTSPPARVNGGMASDKNGKVVLFGGFNGVNLADTWLWDGSNWSQANPATSPPARTGQAMARDGSGNIVLFGGCCGPGFTFLSDTWVWDGSNWKQASPTTSPPPRVSARMALDKNGKIVLFGGFGAAGNLGDTWLWDGSNWTQASPATSPPPRQSAAMATDNKGNVVLFGGNGSTLALGDTWLWDGSNWSQPTLATAPSGRSPAALATETNGTVVLFGGVNAGTNQFFNDTWLWDGSSWTQASPATSPSARYGTGMATDSNGNLVLFGGQTAGAVNLNDTWLLVPLQDTTPPVITVPANITTTATSPAGATVNYTVSASDAVDGPVPVTCVPASGTTFAIGVTTVNCSASDKAGNVGQASFTVTVTATDTTPPTTPTNLTTPTRGKTTMGFAWGASTDPDDTTLIYDIYVNDKRVGDTGKLTFQVPGLSCGTRYVFGVSARDIAGNVSGRATKIQTTLACG